MPNPRGSAERAAGTRAAARRPGERRLRILQALALMLERPTSERVTTAALAQHLEVSEAALYRHFASKAQMFEGLIEFIEESVFGLINRIIDAEGDGLRQAHQITMMLLGFSQTNRGMTRVLIGDALVIEDERLQERMNRFFDRVEASLRQSLKIAVAQGHLATPDLPAVRASLLVAYVVGRWTRYARSGWQRDPLEHADLQLATLLA